MHYVQLIIVIAVVAASAVTMTVIHLVTSRKDVAPKSQPVEEYVPGLWNIWIIWSPDDLRFGRLLYQSGRRFVYLHGGAEDYIIAESGQFFALKDRTVSEVVKRSWCLPCGVNVVNCTCYEDLWLTYKEVPLTTED